MSYYSFILIFNLSFLMGCHKPVDRDLKLWYDTPARTWTEALPLGNGLQGAMIYGRTHHEWISLNHTDFWSGAPGEWNNPGAAKVLHMVMEAMAEEDYAGAEELCHQMQGPYNQSFQPLAELKLDFKDTSAVTGYYRDLNISRSIATVSYVQNGITFRRECLISYPDRVLVMKITADKKASVSFSLSMDSQVLHKNSIRDQFLVQRVKAPKHVEPNYRWNLPVDETVIYDDWDGEGMEAETWVKVVNRGGKVWTGSDSVSIQVENADEVVLLLSSATSFNGRFKSPGREGLDPADELSATFTRIAGKSYADIKASHTKDYTALFDRVNLQIGEEKKDQLPTDQRVINYSNDHDP
ncbi:MAG: glycoside hydrolase family 95 protein, partial [Bacteroidales bacterium]